jgi:hypothetical protein
MHVETSAVGQRTCTTSKTSGLLPTSQSMMLAVRTINGPQCLPDSHKQLAVGLAQRVKARKTGPLSLNHAQQKGTAHSSAVCRRQTHTHTHTQHNLSQKGHRMDEGRPIIMNNHRATYRASGAFEAARSLRPQELLLAPACACAQELLPPPQGPPKEPLPAAALAFDQELLPP